LSLRTGLRAAVAEDIRVAAAGTSRLGRILSPRNILIFAPVIFFGLFALSMLLCKRQEPSRVRYSRRSIDALPSIQRVHKDRLQIAAPSVKALMSQRYKLARVHAMQRLGAALDGRSKWPCA
jgi:hypothetical protein